MRLGRARPDRAGSGRVRRGEAGCGSARYGVVGYGTAREPMAHVLLRLSESVEACHGKFWLGQARRGQAGYGKGTNGP